MANSFVTGGTGLLGTHLILELLGRGQNVRALKRPDSDLSITQKVLDFYAPGKDLFDQIEWHEGDILDMFALEEAMQGMDEVYHCAALVSFHPIDDQELMRINVDGTANVVNAALASGIKRFCHVSSTGAVGKKALEDHVDESSPWHDHSTNSAYTTSKHLAEREIWRGAEEGLDVVIVNPSIIIGPGDWNRSSGALFQKIWKGFKFYTDGVNGFVGARDVARAMFELMEKGAFRERYLVTSENLTYKQYFDLVAQALGRPKANIKANRFMTGMAWRSQKLLGALTGKQPGFTKHNARSTHSKHFYSNEKLRNELDMELMPVKSVVENAGAFFKLSAKA